MQVKGVVKKTVKENSTIPVTLGSHGVKSSRPKTTNPKPFKLRTDVCNPSDIHHHQDY